MYHPWRAFRREEQWELAFRRLPARRRAQVDFQTGLVTLSPTLDQAARRCAICHELIHIERGPVPSEPVLHAKEEAAVRREVALRLVDLPRLIRALQWSQWPNEVADDCWVDTPTLQTRLDHLTPAERSAIEAALTI